MYDSLPTVLVVDDDRTTCTLLEGILEKEGYWVHVTNTGEAALEYIRQELVDVVILDVMLPGLDGIETCRRIRKDARNRSLPVVFITAVSDKLARIEGKQAGGDDFLLKPIEGVELLARVHNLLQVRRYHQHLEQEKENLRRTVEEQSDLLGKAMVEIAKATQSLRYLSEELVFRLSKAVESRDEETGNHVQRMSRYCGLIASKLGMSPEMCEAIRIASALHDVGKIAMPDTLLHKPSRFDTAEMTVMRRHTEIGFQMLTGSKSDLLELAATMARTHHEKWDGSGYSRGLAGEAIPIEGRIAAVADVYDALTSKRVYKRAMPVEDALAFLEENKGGHFDPMVVEAFSQGLPEAKNIMIVFADR